MFKSLLIANRGEIAVRVIRTARAMGLRTIAVYSDADANAYHVAEADEAVHIGPAAAAESYLRPEKIIEAAKLTGAEAIHPGYGFLSENAAFAEACAEAGIIFVGPPAEAIRAMGLKDAAKALMEKADVPVVPGYHGDNQDPEFLAGEAERIGYPVLIKAVAGGGGKGMRRVDAADDFAKALKSAQREASSAFSDERVLIEKFVTSPRHIEVQVFADGHGNVVSLWERDCSLQRRHQKVIEEAPAPGMPSDMRDAMSDAAVKAALAIGYRGAGTIEFIADGSNGLSKDRFFFMEMNTRLQVEHPVTEAITGQDLVEWQLRVAAGEPLPLAQDEIPLNGHAVEARLYAEDPAKSFFPSTGRLVRLRMPQNRPEIRTDMGVREGDEVTMFYDPMIGKIIAHGADRHQAIGALANFLRQMEVAGPKTNLRFLERVMSSEAFRAAHLDTGFIDRHISDLVPKGPAPAEVIALAALGHLLARDERQCARQLETAEPHSPWAANDSFVLGGHRREVLRLECDGDTLMVGVEPSGEGWRIQPEGGEALVASGTLSADGALLATVGTRRLRAGFVAQAKGFVLIHEGASYGFDPHDALEADDAAEGGTGAVTAPMPGKVIQVAVKPGDRVKKGSALVVLEAMKMEQTLSAASDGVVASVNAGEGDQVDGGAVLVTFEEE
ncbi:acetyl/propionyl/methylcrotonyl-CoA carboxylase subunit alpha [Parvibaculum sp. MBR-TMA-1.3b-4.2]|jgi:3-methylcrotonyl-CoA carboxylase alpha subunit